MGILSTLLGNVSNIDIEKIENDLSDVIFDAEEIKYAFCYVRDIVVFTNCRFIFIDKQGITGKKRMFHSIPYSSVTHFSFETSGHFDDDCEIKFYVRGISEPIVKEFHGEKNVALVQKLIAQKICK